MNPKIRIFLAICATAILLGCGRHRTVPINPAVGSSESQYGPRLAIRSMADLRQRLPVGLRTNEIVARFGPPDSTEEAAKGRFEWTYSLLPFPADNMRPGTYAYAVTVTITNGHLAWWGCSYIRPPGATIAHEEVYSNSGSRPSQSNGQEGSLLKFFIVSTNPITGGRSIDTEEFPKLGFISSKANLEISSLKGVTVEERMFGGPGNANQKVWTLTFHLLETDAPRFESLTADNVDKRFLMMIADKPAFSASILEPIPGGNFRFESTNQAAIEAIKKQLINTGRGGLER